MEYASIPVKIANALRAVLGVKKLKNFKGNGKICADAL